jgi:hypothetical protein
VIATAARKMRAFFSDGVGTGTQWRQGACRLSSFVRRWKCSGAGVGHYD